METTKTSLTRTVLAGGLAAIVVATAVGAYAVDAHDSEGERPDRAQIEAVHEAARAAVEAGDYGAWAEALADAPKADERVNEMTFNVLVEASALRDAGDDEAARELLRENDIRPHRRGHNKDGERPELSEEERAEREARRDEVRSAVAAGDYDAWATALADAPHADEFVNEANFTVIAEAHSLREAGDREAARDLLQENDIRLPGKHGPRGSQR